jgi:hypothetical protein
MANVKVCDGKWNGVKNESFTWTNHDTTSAVVISQDGNTTWPFTTPTVSPYTLTVARKTTSPGTLPCQLKDLAPGSYTYNSAPCPTRGNPKTVIIT